MEHHHRIIWRIGLVTLLANLTSLPNLSEMGDDSLSLLIVRAQMGIYSSWRARARFAKAPHLHIYTSLSRRGGPWKSCSIAESCIRTPALCNVTRKSLQPSSKNSSRVDRHLRKDYAFPRLCHEFGNVGVVLLPLAVLHC
jgi:hypothetical protein